MRKTLALADLRRTFVRIGFKPRLMRDLVKSISAEGLTDIDAGVSRFLLDERQLAGWQALLQPHDLFERAVLVTIAQGRPPMGRETLAALARLPGPRPTVTKVRGDRATAPGGPRRQGCQQRDDDRRPLVRRIPARPVDRDAHVRWSSSPGAGTPSLRHCPRK